MSPWQTHPRPRSRAGRPRPVEALLGLVACLALLVVARDAGAENPDAGQARGAAAARPRDPVVYPRGPRSSFSHAAHARSAAPCQVCHPAASSSVRASDALGPTAADCLACHGAKVSPAGTAARDGGSSPALPGLPSLVPPASLELTLKFSHKLHVAQGLACASCHPDGALDDADHASLPTMADCLTCHDGKRASARCSACHPTLPDGRLRTEFPHGRLVPTGAWEGDVVHGPDFRRTHGPVSRDAKRCETCHQRSFCTDCHGEGVIRPAFLHPANYVASHAWEARRNVPDCQACHRTQSFCVGCHQRLGVGADAPGGERGKPAANPFGTGTGIKTFHPPGWVASGAPGAVSGHGVQARRNIQSCASCHREESCLGCHSTDPSRLSQVNPHEPGFAGSARCRALANRNQRACLKCHDPTSPALGCF